ncbi:MAG: ABC transporter permease [Promethearchaeota archaeon]
MNLQRTMALLKIELKKVIREPVILFISILFPVALTLLMGLALSGLDSSSVPGYSVFDTMVPGLFGYACIWITMTVATTFVDDRELGLLKRINTTRTTSGEFMVSHIISNTLISLLQVAIVAVLSFVLGFRPEGGISGFLLAFVFIGFLSICSVGFGLITATIAKNSGAASGVAMIFILPQMLFGSAGMGIPVMESTQLIAMFLPSYYATNSLEMIFRGTPSAEITILTNLGVLAILSIVIVIVGIQLFKRFGKA